MKKLLLLLALLPSIAFAQYPSKPVRVVIHFPAGGSTDLVARVLSQALTESMGQAFVVENRTGADGAIAAAAEEESTLRSAHGVHAGVARRALYVPARRHAEPRRQQLQ
jgi:tripartite-type tricarboxylate transporter receptor subunit TctC